MNFQIRVGASRIVTVTWPSEFSLVDIEAYIDEFTRELKRLRFYPVVIVNDLRALKLGAVDRKSIARVSQFVEQERPLLSERVLGWADVTTSLALRSVLALLGLKSDMPYTRTTCSTVEDAEKWAAKLIVHGKYR